MGGPAGSPLDAHAGWFNQQARNQMAQHMQLQQQQQQQPPQQYQQRPPVVPKIEPAGAKVEQSTVGDIVRKFYRLGLADITRHVMWYQVT